MIGLMNWLNDDLKKVLWFNKWFSFELYSSTEQLEALYIKFCASIGVTCTKESLQLYMQTDMKADMIKIKFNDVSLFKVSVDYTIPKAVDAIYDAVKRNMLSMFEIRMNKPRGLSFLADATIELRNWKKNNINELVSKLKVDLTQSENSAEEVNKFILKYEELNKKLTEDCLLDIDPLTANVSYADIDEIDSRPLYKTGFEPLDMLFEGEILTRQLIGIAAMPGYGKTRWLTRYFIYNALMNKKNVLFDSLDEDSTRIWAYILCIYINDVYHIYIDPKKITTPATLSEEQAKIVKQSKQELRSGENYGKLIIRSNTTLTDLAKHGLEDIKMNNIDIYAIDFLGELSGGEDIEFKRLDVTTLIKRGMEVIKSMTKQGNVLSVVIHQFTKEAEDAVLTGRKMPAEPVQGGTSAKRYSDVLMLMSGKPTIDKDIRIFDFIKTRDNDFTKPFICKADLKNFRFDLHNDINGLQENNKRKDELKSKFSTLD